MPQAWAAGVRPVRPLPPSPQPLRLPGATPWDAWAGAPRGGESSRAVASQDECWSHLDISADWRPDFSSQQAGLVSPLRGWPKPPLSPQLPREPMCLPLLPALRRWARPGDWKQQDGVLPGGGATAGRGVGLAAAAGLLTFSAMVGAGFGGTATGLGGSTAFRASALICAIVRLRGAASW